MNEIIVNHLNECLEYKVIIVNENNIEELYELCKGNIKYYSYLKEEASIEGVRSVLTDLPMDVTKNNKYVLGFYKQDKLVAVLDLVDDYPSKDKIFIGLFMLSIEFQGKNIGKQIIKCLLGILKKFNYVSCHLGVIDSNREAIRFWSKMGFVRNGIVYNHTNYNVIMMDLSFSDEQNLYEEITNYAKK